MADDGRRRLYYRPRAVAATAVLCLLSISAVRPDDREVLSSDHGLASAKDPGSVSPSMADFFRPALPAARNDSEDGAWSLAPPRPPPWPLSSGKDGRRSTAVLAVGVACGALGLAAASLVCLLRAKRSGNGPEAGPASALGSSRRRSGRDEVFYNERWI